MVLSLWKRGAQLAGGLLAHADGGPSWTIKYHLQPEFSCTALTLDKQASGAVRNRATVAVAARRKYALRVIKLEFALAC